MNDLIKLTVDELREIVYDQLPQGYPQPSKEEEALAILARRAQANDALRSVAQWVATAERDLQASALVNDGLFNAKLEQLQERCGDLREALAAAPAPSSSGAPAPADPWTPVQCDYDRDIHANQDANAWADFFVQVHPGLADKHDLMRAWFANAMMAMHDSPRCKPAPADSQREAAIEEWRKGATSVHAAVIDGGGGLSLLDDVFELHADTITEGLALTRSAPPAPVAPVTEGEVEAAISLFGGAAIGQCDEATYNGRKDALRALIARRVAEARGAGLRELRARLVDFCRIRDRGYDVRSDFSPLWVLDAIDRLLAAPPASKLAEEPAQEDDGPCLSALLANMRMEMSDGANGMRTPREEAIAAVVECVARRIEALENNKEAGK